MARRAAPPVPTPDQQADADRLHAALVAAAADLRARAERLATTTDRSIFGANEFVIRDIVLGLGATAIETARDGRKKGATGVRPTPASGAPKPPGSNAGRPGPS